MTIQIPTGAPPTSAGRPAPATAEPAPRDHWRPADQLLVNVFVVLLVLTQRIGIPMLDTSISISLPLGYLLLVVLAARGSLSFSRIRVELLLVALTACFAVTVVVSAYGEAFSLPSLLLLAGIYVPWMFRARTGNGLRVVSSAGRTFVWVMLVLAVVGALQLASQLLGYWKYEDHLADWLPAGYIVPNYHFDNPLEWDSPIFKSTAFVLLEPSFLSQFCALAVLIGLVLRVPAWQLVVLFIGLASSVSGTGIFLLIAGGILLLFRAPQLLRPAYVVAAAVGAVLLLRGPVADLLLSRTDEFTQTESSAYARFVAPYRQVAEGLADEPLRYAFGAGAGSSEDLLLTNSAGFGRDVLYVLLPKLTFEYGIIAGGLFVIFLVVATLRGSPWRLIPGSLLFMVFFLSGALLQPQTAFLVWVFTTLGSRDEAEAELATPDG